MEEINGEEGGCGGKGNGKEGREAPKVRYKEERGGEGGGRGITGIWKGQLPFHF